MNTPGALVIPADSAAGRAYAKGLTVFRYTNTGTQTIGSSGALDNDGAGGLPYCGSRKSANGASESEWRFCVDHYKRGCASQPAGPSSGWTERPGKRLDTTQKTQIATILIEADLRSKRTRAMVQLQVWCVSEKVSVGTVYKDAQNYFNSHQLVGTGGEAPLSDSESRCASRPAQAQPTNPTLTLSGPSSALTAGDSAAFAISTNLTSPIQLTTTGERIQLCPVTQSGVTLQGSSLQFSRPGSATICSRLNSAGTVTVTATSEAIIDPATLSEVWSQDSGCQVFVDYVAGKRNKLSRSAKATFESKGNFRVEKTWDGLAVNDGDLDDVVVPIHYDAGAEGKGTLWLNQRNGFKATGPTLNTGTVVSLTEGEVTGLPAAIEQEGVSWTLDGKAVTGPVSVTIGANTTASVSASNALRPVLGTFNLRKKVVLPEGVTPPLDDVIVEVEWEAEGFPRDSHPPIRLHADNGFSAVPRDAEGSVVLFPIGTAIRMFEGKVTGAPEVLELDPSWGSNADPQNPKEGIVVIAQEWDASDPASASLVTLTNGVDVLTSSLRVKKAVDGLELGEGAVDDLEVVVAASWTGGATVILLNEENGWTGGLGVDLPLGTQVNLSEVGIHSSDPSLGWADSPVWSCSACTAGSFEPQSDGTAIATIAAGDAIPEATALNSFEVLRGGFEIGKKVIGEINFDDPRVKATSFSVDWTSSDADHPSGTIVLEAPTWRGTPVDSEGNEVRFPLGTLVKLNEAKVHPAEWPGVEWIGDPQWSAGQQEDGTAELVISDKDQNASLTLTNEVQVHEGRIALEKLVHSAVPVDAENLGFTVAYTTSTGETGNLSVKGFETVTSPALPTGTEVTLSEVLPNELPPGTVAWREPQFVLEDGSSQPGPITVVVGDGTDVAVDLVNELDPKPVVPPRPEKPTDPEPPATPKLPAAGSNPEHTAWLLATAVVALSGGMVLVLRRGKARR